MASFFTLPTTDLDISLAVLLLVAVTGLAYLLKGLTGFGPALVYVPVCSLIFDVPSALVSITILELFGSALVVLKSPPSQSEIRQLSPMLTAVFFGSIIGAFLVGVLPTWLLFLAIGLVTYSVAFFMWRAGDTVIQVDSVRHERRLLGGIVGGISGGLSGVSGPFLVGALGQISPHQLRKSLSLAFLIEDPGRLIVFFLVGVGSLAAALLGLFLLPVALAATFLGYSLHSRFSVRALRLIILFLLAVLGALCFTQASGVAPWN